VSGVPYRFIHECGGQTGGWTDRRYHSISDCICFTTLRCFRGKRYSTVSGCELYAGKIFSGRDFWSMYRHKNRLHLAPAAWDQDASQTPKSGGKKIVLLLIPHSWTPSLAAVWHALIRFLPRRFVSDYELYGQVMSGSRLKSFAVLHSAPRWLSCPRHVHNDSHLIICFRSRRSCSYHRCRSTQYRIYDA